MTIIVTCVQCDGYIEADNVTALDRRGWEIGLSQPSGLEGVCPDCQSGDQGETSNA